LRKGLEIRAGDRETPKVAITIGAIVFLCVALGMLVFWHSPSALMPLFILLMIFAIATMISKRTANLQVTKFEFVGLPTVRKGKSGGGPVRLNTADVRWLEYRNANQRGILSVGASGLYAVKATGATCILPFVNFQEAAIIIRAIETKFPGLGEMWRSNLQAGAATERTGNRS
jgi:hypothetical protein